MLEGLNNYAFAVSFPFGAGGTGNAFHQSGDEAFNEQGLELAYGKNLGRLDIGIVFDYLRDQAAGYTGQILFPPGVGIRLPGNRKINRRMGTGFACFRKSR